MTSEAMEQDSYLSHMRTLSNILGCDIKTIRVDIKRIQERLDILVPTRGNIHYMGPTLTHRQTMCYKYYKEAKTVKYVCREAKHSKEAVDRYINALCGAYKCLKEN